MLRRKATQKVDDRIGDLHRPEAHAARDRSLGQESPRPAPQGDRVEGGFWMGPGGIWRGWVGGGSARAGGLQNATEAVDKRRGRQQV